jgi:hypothetical protein
LDDDPQSFLDRDLCYQIERAALAELHRRVPEADVPWTRRRKGRSIPGWFVPKTSSPGCCGTRNARPRDSRGYCNPTTFYENGRNVKTESSQ